MACTACRGMRAAANFRVQAVLRYAWWWILLFSVAAFILAATSRLLAQSAAEFPVYLDPKQSIGVRVNDLLLGRMTLKEKVGQLNLPCVYVDQLGKTVLEKMNACRRFTMWLLHARRYDSA